MRDVALLACPRDGPLHGITIVGIGVLRQTTLRLRRVCSFDAVWWHMSDANRSTARSADAQSTASENTANTGQQTQQQQSPPQQQQQQQSISLTSADFPPLSGKSQHNHSEPFMAVSRTTEHLNIANCPCVQHQIDHAIPLAAQ
jgi:hypothetical protein